MLKQCCDQTYLFICYTLNPKKIRGGLSETRLGRDAPQTQHHPTTSLKRSIRRYLGHALGNTTGDALSTNLVVEK
jgi:hypothetical protein